MRFSWPSSSTEDCENPGMAVIKKQIAIICNFLILFASLTFGEMFENRNTAKMQLFDPKMQS
jgi:hypothetical protein